MFEKNQNLNSFLGTLNSFLTPTPRDLRPAMSLWVDKQRPDRLSKLSLHPGVTRKLTALAKSDEIPHLLFYGPPGA
jgi:hypothetical protein